MAEDRMLSDEILLGLIKKNGGPGTTDYEDLENLPEIDGVELKGNKTLSDLGIASASDLAEKQDALTAGSHIEISSNTVSVNRYAIPAGNIVYRVITGDYSSGEVCYVDKYKSDGSFIERITVNPNLYGTQDVDGYIRIKKEWNRWEISLLAASKEQSAGYQYAVNPKTTETENSFTFTIPQVEDDNDLIIRSELATKQNILTFDDTPTDGSNNPVKSNGIYDALATKANTDMVAADFNAGTSYTAGNYCIYEGKFYKFKNNHSGAWSAADVDEIKIAGELSTLKSGLKSGITGNFPVSYVQGWQIIKHIAFDAPFDTVPAVLVQSLFTGGTNGDVYEPANITVNGFDINMYSPIVGSFDYFNFSWLATTT